MELLRTKIHPWLGQSSGTERAKMRLQSCSRGGLGWISGKSAPHRGQEALNRLPRKWSQLFKVLRDFSNSISMEYSGAFRSVQCKGELLPNCVMQQLKK